MPELLIPFAVDDEQKLYSPASAEKGTSYFCPSCGEPVIFRQGAIRAAHFAHKVTDTCNQETITHETAKLLVQRAVQEWKSGRSKSPTLERACQICGSTVGQALPDKVDGAVLEYKLSDGSIADVALIVGSTPQAVVEIRVTHAVDDVKTSRLPVPFIELDGYEVIANPTVWKTITDHFKAFTCENCKSTYAQFHAKAKRIAQAIGLELPKAYYRYGFCKCWKCKREIIVFAWPKNSMHDNSAPKIQPPPKTVQYRFSKTAGNKYWVNTCLHCASIQGDFFLYSEPDGPFFAINCEEDTRAEFDRDMMKIAAYAVQIDVL